MSRKPHKPTDAMRQTVQLHTTVGTTQALIARILDIDLKTLRLYYRDELDIAKAKANATIGGALFNKAKGGDTAAMIFWMKTQAGWRETADPVPEEPVALTINLNTAKPVGEIRVTRSDT